MKIHDGAAFLASLGSLGGAAWSVWKGYRMMKQIQQVFAALALVVIAVELETEGQGKGAEKKQKAQEKLRAVLDPLLPDWLNPVVYSAAGYLIDGLVMFANRTGLFAGFAAASSS